MDLLRGKLLSYNEMETFKVLEECFHNKYWIGSKVDLKSVFDIEHPLLTKEERDFSFKSHFDFLICKKTPTLQLKPLLALEFDGMHHTHDAKQKKRDEIKDGICRKAGLDIIRIRFTELERYDDIRLLKWILHNYLDERYHSEYCRIAFKKEEELLDEEDKALFRPIPGREGKRITNLMEEIEKYYEKVGILTPVLLPDTLDGLEMYKETGLIPNEFTATPPPFENPTISEKREIEKEYDVVFKKMIFLNNSSPIKEIDGWSYVFRVLEVEINSISLTITKMAGCREIGSLVSAPEVATDVADFLCLRELRSFLPLLSK